MSARWTRRDVVRLRNRWDAGPHTDAEIAYLRGVAFLLLAGPLELDDDDRELLQLFVNVVSVYDIEAEE